jgi:hypothetical protein
LVLCWRGVHDPHEIIILTKEGLGMADGEIDQIGSIRAFVESEAKMAKQAIVEFDGVTVSNWCVERGLFTDRAIGGYGLAMRMVAERIGTATDARTAAR